MRRRAYRCFDRRRASCGALLRHRGAAVAVLATTLASACATFRCVDTTVVVEDTRRDERLESRVESMHVEPVFGRVQEIRRDVLVTTYWVRAADGEWIAVAEATWRRAEKGKPLAVCR